MNNHAACGEYVKRMYAKSAQYGILPACVGKPWPGKYTSAPSRRGTITSTSSSTSTRAPARAVASRGP